MLRLKLTLISLIIGLHTTSCTHIMVISARPGKGGEFSISKGVFDSNGTSKDLSEAEMRATCPRGYRITERRQVSSDMCTSNNPHACPSHWVIEYRCKKGFVD